MSRSPSPYRLPTRADVARYAGESEAVVSYVMNSGPRPVAPKTADRVRAAIDVLGYRPNLSARALISPADAPATSGRTARSGLEHR